MKRRAWTGVGAVVLAAAVVAVATSRGGSGDETTPTQVRLDLSLTKGRDAAFLRTFDTSALVQGAAIDSIPAIDDPLFDTAAKASRLLAPEDLVVGIERSGDARAYPTNLLSLHEVVNDVVGGTPVVVTWCPLCITALAYERRVGGRELVFGVSGYLYARNLVLFDRQTGSLWSQLLGGAVTGEYRGTALRGVPVVHETWSSWHSKHPDTKVLSFERDRLAGYFTLTESGIEVTGFGADAADSPSIVYATKVPYYYRAEQGGLVGATRVYGIVVRGRAKAYPLGELRRRGTIRDRVGGVAVVVSYDDDAFSAVAHARGVQLPGTFSYWFAWRAIHPETLVFPG